LGVYKEVENKQKIGALSPSVAERCPLEVYIKSKVDYED